MGTQVERSSAEKDLAKRGCGYAMPHYARRWQRLDIVIAEFSKANERAVRGEGPSYIVANTYRFRGHSMSDPMKYRTKEEQETAKLRDPITLYRTGSNQNRPHAGRPTQQLEADGARSVCGGKSMRGHRARPMPIRFPAAGRSVQRRAGGRSIRI